MFFFKKQTKGEAEIQFAYFIDRLIGGGFDAEVSRRSIIKKKCDRGSYDRVRGALRILKHKKVLISFWEDEEKSAWASIDYPDRIAINMAREPKPTEYQEAEKELRELALVLALIKEK